MLEFIIGRACTGKTYETINRVADASQNGKVVLIVPEQFSFESERAVIKRTNAVPENIRVLSFSRLYDDVVASSSVGSAVCISDFEKIILMKKAIGSCIDNLKIFSKYAAYNDFTKKLTDTVRDFKFAGVSAPEIASAADTIGGTCGAKLHDIALVMSAYDALITNKFIDPADRLTKLNVMLTEFSYFKDTSVFFDSFTGFTGQQYKIIERIIEQADKVTFSFCTDDPEDTSLSLFHNINSAIRKIKSIAHSRGVNDCSFTRLDKHHYSDSSLLSVENYMAGNRRYLGTACSPGVNIISCDNRHEEALAAVNIVAKEVSENGYRFKDFILVARNADEYANAVARQCEINDIACFMDKSVALTHTPLYLYVEKLLELSGSFTTENVLKLVKMNLTDLSENEISELENYTYVWDIKSADWQNEWKMSVRGLQTDEDNRYDAERLKNINLTRQKIVDAVSRFKDSFRGTPASRCKAIYMHLTGNHIDRNLSKLCDFFEDEGNQAYASVLKQCWDTVISVLDSVVRVLDDVSISSEDFIDSFKIAAEAATISNIPQMLDEITFGSADRIRPSKPKISVILGANQGIFPNVPGNSGILIRSDKEKLIGCGIVLDDDIIRSAIEENYLVYSMVCCPVDKVYILYSQRSVKGEELEPSAFVTGLIDNFEGIAVRNFTLSSCGEFVPRTARSAFNESGRVGKKAFAEIKRSLTEYTEFFEKLDVVETAGNQPDFTISKANSHGLFGDELHISATKFDTYHKCSLSYLLKSGLRIQKLQKADLNVLQRGTIAHYVLESIIGKYRGELAQLSKLQISAEVDILIHEYISAVNGSELLMTARFAYLLDKISASVKEIVCHIAEEFAQSDFEPRYCELTIGSDGDIPRMEYLLSDGSKACFDGKIDRVDVYKNNVRVVDYKTGRMTFTLSDTLVGLNMQMLLYLYAFVKNGGRLVSEPQPAGILYMPAKGGKDKKTLQMNGLILKDDEIRYAMEKDNKGVFVPKFTDRSNDYVDRELFGLIFEKIDSLMCKMGDRIREGLFDADPTDGVNTNACAYCDFSSICRSSGKKHNSVSVRTNGEIAEILKAGDNSGISTDS